MRTARLLLCSLILLLPFPAAADLIIIPHFDSTITSNADASQIESTIDSALNVYESEFATNITVNIYFQTFDSNCDCLGESDVGRVYEVPYQTFYDQLTTIDANPAAIASLNANGGDGNTNGGVDPVLGKSDVVVKSANARALGFTAAALCYVTAGDTTPASDVPNHCGSSGSAGSLVDGIISLNTFITSPPNSLSGFYSLESTVEHEVDEVLGLGSSLPNTSASSGTVTNSFVAPEDLWRYSPSGQRVFSVNCAAPGTAVFSVNGTGQGQGFNNSCNGADFGDWAGGGSAQVQDAYATPGANPTLGTNEAAALTAVGYQLAVPEPATFGLLFSSLGLAAVLGRRNRGGSR